MISLSSASLAPGLPDLLVFSDDADPGLRHVLALALVADGVAGLTVMGRGRRTEAAGILGGFWSLPLRGAVTDADRATLALQGGTRLVMAEAGLEVQVDLTPSVSAHAQSSGWRGGPVALTGEIPTGRNGAAFARAWGDGLPDATAALTLTVSGMGEPAEMTVADHRLRVAAAPGRLHLHSMAGTMSVRRQSAATLTIRHSHPLRLRPDRADDGIIWAGFD